jgi:hypothetical protein
MLIYLTWNLLLKRIFIKKNTKKGSKSSIFYAFVTGFKLKANQTANKSRAIEPVWYVAAIKTFLKT